MGSDEVCISVPRSVLRKMRDKLREASQPLVTYTGDLDQMKEQAERTRCLNVSIVLGAVEDQLKT